MLHHVRVFPAELSLLPIFFLECSFQLAPFIHVARRTYFIKLLLELCGAGVECREFVNHVLGPVLIDKGVVKLNRFVHYTLWSHFFRIFPPHEHQYRGYDYNQNEVGDEHRELVSLIRKKRWQAYSNGGSLVAIRVSVDFPILLCFGVGKRLIRFRNPDEFFCSHFVPRVLIRVKLKTQLSIRFLDIPVARSNVKFQNLKRVELLQFGAR
mmetsp:Transcript_8428/g.16329  ORF Transcript_8428/g.16329 Transcript_8428/m.16329 type:complete len:210 (+) Transcript_8428:1593-2222(+)